MGKLITTISSPIISTDYYDTAISSSILSKAKISMDCFDEDELKKKITQILLEDPDSEVKRMAEDYLIQCLYEATNDPENNPILYKFFGDIRDLKNDILMLKGELQMLRDRLGIDKEYTNDEVAWTHHVNDQFEYLENKLIKITEKLGKAGIDINYWES